MATTYLNLKYYGGFFETVAQALVRISPIGTYETRHLASLFFAFFTAYDMVRLHLYQSIYFNRVFAGGLEKSGKQYDTDYWGMAYRAGIEWVIENYKESERPVYVQACSPSFLIGYFLDTTNSEKAGILLEKKEKLPFILLGDPPRRCFDQFDGTTLFEVRRDNTTLLYVKKIRPTTL